VERRRADIGTPVNWTNTDVLVGSSCRYVQRTLVLARLTLLRPLGADPWLGESPDGLAATYSFLLRISLQRRRSARMHFTSGDEARCIAVNVVFWRHGGDHAAVHT
jgi:hypothetical protein